MRKLFTIILTIFLGSTLLSEASPVNLKDETLQSLLDSLDVTLSHKDDYMRGKEQRIRSIKSTLAQSSDPERRYWLTNDLFNEYRAYDSDSALMYLNESYRIARSLGRRDWMDDVSLNSAYIYAATGLFDKAEEALERVQRDSLPPAMLMRYYENKVFMLTHRGQFLGEIYETKPYADEVDSLLAVITPTLETSDPKYLWFKGWNAMRTPETAREVLPEIIEVMRDRKYDNGDDAKAAWMLGMLYKLADDSTSYVKYITLSAIADVKACNKEIASLEELSDLLYQCEDFERANRYIAYCIQCANYYKSRVRVGRLADLQYQISDSFSRELAHNGRQLNHYMWGLIGIIVIFFCALCFIIVQMRDLKKSRKALHDTNAELHKRVGELNDARASLDEANRKLAEKYNSVQQDAMELSMNNEAKERYIADIFTICSDYISKLDDFRKKINRMIIAGRLDEVRELTKSPDLSQSELRELYNNFDRIFLKIFPDFVDDFNSLLQPDKRIEPRKGELLTTDLRIYALVRLGLNDSVKIARFLHYSVQTVYNTRQRTRNKAILPKDEFIEAVRRLGNPRM